MHGAASGDTTLATGSRRSEASPWTRSPESRPVRSGFPCRIGAKSRCHWITLHFPGWTRKNLGGHHLETTPSILLISVRATVSPTRPFGESRIDPPVLQVVSRCLVYGPQGTRGHRSNTNDLRHRPELARVPHWHRRVGGKPAVPSVLCACCGLPQGGSLLQSLCRAESP